MVWCFHCTLLPLFILSYFTMDELQNFVFFSLILKFFLGDLVLIKDPLILNSYERVWLEEGGPKWKTRKTWVACHKFKQRCTLVLQLKQPRKLYNFGSSTFYQFYFGMKVHFFFLSIGPWLGKERERDCRIPAIER